MSAERIKVHNQIEVNIDIFLSALRAEMFKFPKIEFRASKLIDFKLSTRSELRNYPIRGRGSEISNLIDSEQSARFEIFEILKCRVSNVQGRHCQVEFEIL